MDGMGMAKQAIIIGLAIGRAIANDVLRDDLPRRWTGLDPQDGDQLTAVGIEAGTAEWQLAEDIAKAEYQRLVQS